MSLTILLIVFLGWIKKEEPAIKTNFSSFDAPEVRLSSYKKKTVGNTHGAKCILRINLLFRLLAYNDQIREVIEFHWPLNCKQLHYYTFIIEL
jgi:hypothetical protein